MSNIQNRPYAGTWKLNNRSVVKYTPDALVFINGDTSMPGCARCRGRIEVQKFVTSISVDAGTEPTSHSATINMSLPRVQGEQVFIDGYNILRAGLEVHIFMRGFFPVRGMFKHLSDPQAGRDIQFANPTDSDQLDLSKYATYPYYPVFHGVITQVSYDYSDGFYTGTLNCASLLHFWNFINITTGGAFMAQDKRPSNDAGRPTLFGHNFNNVHPFSIMYTLYRDIAGSAAGVDYALDEESNLSAAQTETGRQLYDMVSLYWEQRFKTRIQTLRMYGTNGQLFNAAQQAWLGGADTRDAEGLLPSSTYNDPSSTRTETDPLSSRQSVAKALGLQGSGADFVYSPLIGQNNELFNLSVLDMYAFDQAIGEIGTPNLWVSTYQTKMNVAQRVMEVTGYEFYQDVDGDLVFKPPFWNLDTATNRYYRLEDSDIINISFTEKEPTATYIIVRGVWFEGLKADGLAGGDPTTEKRGLYIDYKLVAQFGWRPAPSLDLTYVTDPKILFWIGVARLDALNVDTFSASATIPIRPELRPGFPVYIPFADCYYYISQLSHSFAFGGQCTTNLVLTCRRAKWHAPGYLEPAPEGQSAVVKIRLDRPDLPPRPLEIFENGIPRIVGFPNVVMALDPRQVNPNFSVVGAGIDYFDQFDARTSADLLFGWLQRDVASLAAFEAVGYETLPDGTQIISDPRMIQRFRFRYGNNEFIEFSLDDLVQAFGDYKAAHDPLKASRGERNSAQEQVTSASAADNAFDPVGQAQGASTGTARTPALSNLDAKEANLLDQERKFHQTLGESGGLQLLTMVFDALQPESNKPIRRKVDGIAGSDVRLSYFETLSHLKSQYIAGSVPGNYRYFSCSHPFTSQQGMPILEWDDGERAKGTTTSTGSQQRSSGTRQQRPASTNFFPPGDNLFSTIQSSLATLPGIDNWLNPDSLDWEMRKLLGLTGGRADASNDALDERKAQNLMDIVSVGNTIVNRILADAAYQEAVRDSDGFVRGNPLLISGFRANLEPASAEAYHSQGNAIDISFADGGNSAAAAKGVTPQFQVAIGVVRREVAAAVNEGLVQGTGFYILNSETFVHIDRRPQDSRQALHQSFQDKREDYEAGRIGAPELEGKPGSAAYARSYRKREKFFKRIGKADPVTGTKEKPEAIFPKSAGGWTEGKPSPPSWSTFGAKFRGKSIPPIDKLELGSAPESAPQPAPPPVPPPQAQPTPTQPVAPSIIERPLSTDAERLVVQFKTTVSKPDSALRAPEAELGVGRVNQGIQIALGPQRAPRVLTTDQIQSISFVRHRAAKFTQLIGPSQTSGRTSFNAQGFQGVVAQRFKDATQDLEDGEQTLSDVFEDLYNQFRDDLKEIPIPTYENGIRGDDTFITLTEFPDVLVMPASAIPAPILPEIEEKFGASDEYLLSGFQIKDLSTFPGYVPGGPQTDPGQTNTRAAIVAGSNYAASISRQIEDKFDEVNATALTPSGAVGTNPPKDERLAQISAAFNDAANKALGISQPPSMITENTVVEATPNQGKIDKPIHTPVFPVSDEKGYVHYGAYRYGRGLSVEQGGTFEFIHSGQDPFKNVTAQTAEEFLRVLTLTKQGRTQSSEGAFGQVLRGAQEAAAKMVEFVLNQRQEPLNEDIASLSRDAETTGTAVVGPGDVVEKVGLSERERNQVEQSVQDLAQVVTELGQTSKGQDVLRELLTANGDDPNLLKQDSFDISDTQFARNFTNFAVNFGKSPVFKTTAANAAYQLSDLTSHLLSRAGEACICRGSYADVTMAAYAKENFVTVEGIDQEQDKATAQQSETIIQLAPEGVEQEKRVRGAILEGEQPDAKAFADAQNAGIQAVDLGAPLPGGGQVPSQQGAGTVSPENPPTTVDPNELPSVLDDEEG